jgi:hypothetical protein
MKAVRRIVVLLACAVWAAGCAAPSNPEAEEKAVQAAGQWLQLVDDGKYDESWQQAADLFRKAVNAEQWRSALDGSRRAFGKVLSREVKSKRYATALPGAPDGQYVIIQYQTSFEQKRQAVETVTPMRDQDGTWRVSGYYVR